ncbi:MAG TPA: DUF2267 domain-containing protein [Planctomycetaceae bacterium]
MATLGTDVIDHATEKTNEWLLDVAMRLGPGEDKSRAYRALRAVLHALRDRLGVNEAAHFAAQLPLLVRGVFYEGWHPAGKPLRMHRDEFLAHVGREFGPEAGLEPEELCRAVFATVEEHVTPGEAEKVLQCLPADLRGLWP